MVIWLPTSDLQAMATAINRGILRDTGEATAARALGPPSTLVGTPQPSAMAGPSQVAPSSRGRSAPITSPWLMRRHQAGQPAAFITEAVNGRTYRVPLQHNPSRDMAPHFAVASTPPQAPMMGTGMGAPPPYLHPRQGSAEAYALPTYLPPPPANNTIMTTPQYQAPGHVVAGTPTPGVAVPPPAASPWSGTSSPLWASSRSAQRVPVSQAPGWFAGSGQGPGAVPYASHSHTAYYTPTRIPVPHRISLSQGVAPAPPPRYPAPQFHASQQVYGARTDVRSGTNPQFG